MFLVLSENKLGGSQMERNNELKLSVHDYFFMVIKLKSLVQAGIISREVAEATSMALAEKFKTKHIYIC